VVQSQIPATFAHGQEHPIPTGQDLLYMFRTVHCHISSNKKTNKMHTYYVLHFTRLHVSVPLDHVQGTFCYRIHLDNNVSCNKRHVGA
jgi:hypothetical protein